MPRASNEMVMDAVRFASEAARRLEGDDIIREIEIDDGLQGLPVAALRGLAGGRGA